MGFNLDFSGWKDMRKAQAESILNSANVTANAIANKYKVYNKVLSSLLGSGAKAYDNYLKKKDEEDKEVAEEASEEALAGGLDPNEGYDPMQLLSAANKIAKQEDVNEKRAKLIENYMRYV